MRGSRDGYSLANCVAQFRHIVARSRRRAARPLAAAATSSRSRGRSNIPASAGSQRSSTGRTDARSLITISAKDPCRNIRSVRGLQHGSLRQLSGGQLLQSAACGPGHVAIFGGEQLEQLLRRHRQPAREPTTRRRSAGLADRCRRASSTSRVGLSRRHECPSSRPPERGPTRRHRSTRGPASPSDGSGTEQLQQIEGPHALPGRSRGVFGRARSARRPTACRVAA